MKDANELGLVRGVITRDRRRRESRALVRLQKPNPIARGRDFPERWCNWCGEYVHRDPCETCNRKTRKDRER